MTDCWFHHNQMNFGKSALLIIWDVFQHFKDEFSSSSHILERKKKNISIYYALFGVLLLGFLPITNHDHQSSIFNGSFGKMCRLQIHTSAVQLLMTWSQLQLYGYSYMLGFLHLSANTWLIVYIHFFHSIKKNLCIYKYVHNVIQQVSHNAC